MQWSAPAALGITENTVKNHFKNIMSKLGTSDRTESVTVAVSHDPDDWDEVLDDLAADPRRS